MPFYKLIITKVKKLNRQNTGLPLYSVNSIHFRSRQVQQSGYDIVIEGNVLTTHYFGKIGINTILTVLEEWCAMKNSNNNLSVFVFDYSRARFDNILPSDAIDVANHPIFSAELLEDIYILGVLTENSDYALACLWASWLFKSKTFPRENVFLYRSWEHANQKLLSLKIDTSTQLE